jgi:hypothetical protein
MEETKPAIPEVKKEIIPEPETKPEIIEVKKDLPTVYKKEQDKKLSLADRIVAFVEGRNTDGFVALNPFLKSLYPQPVPGAKPEHERITSLASIRHLLLSLEETGKLKFANRNHSRIGQNYYNIGDPVTKHHNLTSLTIEAKMP